MRKWESWEAETRTLDYLFSNGEFGFQRATLTFLSFHTFRQTINDNINCTYQKKKCGIRVSRVLEIFYGQLLC